MSVVLQRCSHKMEQPIRFLLSRDDWYHQRGYWVVSNVLRESGIEVILGGIQTPREIAETALQEEPDVIGYRIMDGAPEVLVPNLLDRMEEKGVTKPVVVGGIVPEKAEKIIRKKGVEEVFHPHTDLEIIVGRVKAIGKKARSAKEKQH